MPDDGNAAGAGASAGVTERDRVRRVVEAALFLSPRPLTIRELAQRADVSPSDVLSILDDIERRYSEMGSALVLERFGSAVRLYVSPDVLPLVRDLAAVPEFSDRELEVVAYIALKGAATRAELRKLYRSADRVIEKLRSMGAVITKKKGRTVEVRKTELFDRYFGTVRR